jgi:hypothetical protein
MGEIVTREGVVFGAGGGRDLRCDVYAPAGLAAPAPALLLVHGGGWRGGERGMMRGYAERLVARGFVCVASEYRLTPESPWPAQIQDVNTALRWLVASAAELQIDAERIGAVGSSAGAHLVLLAAGAYGVAEFDRTDGVRTERNPIKAVCGIYPPTLFFVGEERSHGGTPARALLGEGATEAQARAAGPVRNTGLPSNAAAARHRRQGGAALGEPGDVRRTRKGRRPGRAAHVR